MRSNGTTIVFLLSVILFTSVASRSQEMDFWENGITKLGNYKTTLALGLSENEKNELKSRWTDIGESLRLENTGFEGTYAKTGYDTGYFLRFSLRKGFILIPYFDESLITDFSYGRVEITKDLEVLLFPDKEMRGDGFTLRITPRIWIPAVNAEFIVPKNEFRSFGLFYGGFGEFNGLPRKRLCDGCDTFASRVDERHSRTAQNLPAPLKYLKFLRKPINGKIVYVGNRRIANIRSNYDTLERSSITPVRINAGRLQRVRPGMMFFLDDPRNKNDQILKVTRVRPSSSDGIVIRSIDKDGNELFNGGYDSNLREYIRIPFSPVKVGIKVTTSPIEH